MVLSVSRVLGWIAEVFPWPASRRLRLVLAAVSSASGLTVGLLTVPLFLVPASAAPTRADAVVVLAGGSGERIERGIEVVRDGHAEVLLVSTGTGASFGSVDCSDRDGTNPVEVICFEPVSDDTRGEARAVAQIAAARQWDKILLVTSTYHLTRATLLFERCSEAEVIGVQARPDIAIPTWFTSVFHEWVGVGLAVTVTTSC